MAAPKRFFVEEIADEVVLSAQESRHVKNVLRLSEGDEVTLFDGSGKEYSAVVTRADKQGVTVHVVREDVSDREPKTDVFLLIGALKGDKTELVVQKATELGVSRIGVFSSRFCAAYMNENKLDRLQRVAREAAKQCLRASVPQVEYFDNLEAALMACADYETKLFACEFLSAGGSSLSDMGVSVCTDSQRRLDLGGSRSASAYCAPKRRRSPSFPSSCTRQGSCDEGMYSHARL